MAHLLDLGTGLATPLRHSHLIGRSRVCDLRLADPRCSAVHAQIVWPTDHWELSDLGSRNGSWVGGRAVAPAKPVELAAGDELGFGGPEGAFRLLDLEPPVAMAQRAPDGPTVLGSGEFLLLPDLEAPAASVYRGPEGAWVLEQGGEQRTAVDRESIALQGCRWTLALPEQLPATWSRADALIAIEQAGLRFRVSLDEENVEIDLLSRGQAVRLGARSGHYLLVTLARLRLRDQAQGVPASEQGWVHQDDLIRMLAIDANVLHVWIHRARRMLAEAGVSNPAVLIERRLSARQLRLGVADLRVERPEEA